MASDLPDLVDVETGKKWSSGPVRKHKALRTRERDELAASAMHALCTTKMVRTGFLFAKAAAFVLEFAAELAAPGVSA